MSLGSRNHELLARSGCVHTPYPYFGSHIPPKLDQLKRPNTRKGPKSSKYVINYGNFEGNLSRVRVTLKVKI